MYLSLLRLGVPKYRTPKRNDFTQNRNHYNIYVLLARLMKRKFGPTRIFQHEENLITCKCGFSHHISTICSVCYEKVRMATNEIKREMMKYNPYLGERQIKQK